MGRVAWGKELSGGALSALLGLPGILACALIGAMTALTGLMQVMMRLLRFGAMVRYLPFPVLAGFLTAVSLAALWSQMPQLLAGLAPGFAARDDLPQPLSILAIVATVVDQIIGTLDHALERAEISLLDEASESTRHVGVPLARAGLFRGFDAGELTIARGFFEERHLSRGDVLFKKGDPVDGLYVIVEGQIGVRIEDAHGVSRRIAAFTPGTMIGEIAFIEGGNRSAQVVAEEESRLWLLKRERLADIEKADPKIVHKLIVNITGEIAERLRHTTDDLRRR